MLNLELKFYLVVQFLFHIHYNQGSHIQKCKEVIENGVFIEENQEEKKSEKNVLDYSIIGQKFVRVGKIQ